MLRYTARFSLSKALSRNSSCTPSKRNLSCSTTDVKASIFSPGSISNFHLWLTVAVGTISAAAWMSHDEQYSYCSADSTTTSKEGEVGSCLRFNSSHRSNQHDLQKEKLFSVSDTSEFAFIVAGAGTAGCLTAYLVARWLEERNLPGKVLLLDRGPDFNGKDGPDPIMESWFGNWGSFGEAHTAYRDDGSDYPVTPTSHNGVGGCGTHDTRISFVMREEQRKRVAEKMGWTEEQCAMYFQAVLDMIPLLPAMPTEEEFYSQIVESLTNPCNPYHLHRLIDNFGNNSNGKDFGDRDTYKKAEPVTNTIGQPLLAMYNNELRWTSAYLLRPGKHRPSNLVVVPDAIVDKVLFEADSATSHVAPLKVSGITFSVQNQKYRAMVRPDGGEIALTSGTMGNVGILQRSGIGPLHILEPLHIPVVGDNAFVGRGIDHPEISIMYEWVKKIDELPRGGVNGWPMVLFGTTLPDARDKTEEFMAHFGAGYAEPYTAFPSVLATPNCMQPSLQAGYLASITSSKPNDSLLLTHFDQTKDYTVMARGIQRMEKVFSQAQQDGLVGNRLLPPPEINLDDLPALVNYVKDNHFTVFHWACTTRAGKDSADSAADEVFRVRRHASHSATAGGEDNLLLNVVSNLRVGSASALPELSEANPHISIHAFSFALAHVLVDAYAAVAQQQQREPVKTSLPSELERARAALRANNGQLVVRKDGEELPRLGRVALEYYAQWKQAHMDSESTD